MAHLEPLGLSALEKIASGMSYLVTDIDEVAKTCVEAGVPISEKIYRNTMAGASPSLGKAAASTNSTPVKKNSLGIYSVSRAVGWNPGASSKYASFHDWEVQHKSRYAMIAAFFNYGVGPHYVDFSATNAYGNSAFVSHGSATHPGMKNAGGKGWHDKAASAAEGPVSAVVSQKFDEEVRRLLG